MAVCLVNIIDDDVSQNNRVSNCSSTKTVASSNLSHRIMTKIVDNNKVGTDKLADVAHTRTILTKTNWLKGKSGTFLRHLDKEKLEGNDESLIICYSDDPNLVVQATVDRIVSHLRNVLLEPDEKTSPFIKICIKNDSKLGKVTKENWLRQECKESGHSYTKAKRYYYKLKTNEAHVQYNLASKQYKKTVNRQRTLFNRDLTEKLRNLRTKDPKAF